MLPARRGGELSLFVIVFLVTALITTLVGFTATHGFSFPIIGGLVGNGSAGSGEWGEIRFVETTTRIRAGRSTETAIRGRLVPGDSVRTDFAEDGWYAVFPVDAPERDVTQALGFVYAPLLKEAAAAGGGAAGR